MRSRLSFFIVFILLSGGVAAAQDVNGDGLITYLLPVNVPRAVGGAFGSSWETTLYVYNGTDVPLNLLGCPTVIIEHPCEGVPFHMPFVTEQAFPYEVLDCAPCAPESAGGPLLFNIPLGAAATILRSRLYEVSRHAQPAGVEIPVVREDEFFTKPSRFIAVPRSNSSRVALRIYDPRRRTDAAVRVDLLDETGTLLGTTTLALTPRSIDSTSPGYAAILDVASAFPQLSGVDHFDVRVTPLVEGMEYWAFASVTDEDTQTVLVVTGME